MSPKKSHGESSRIQKLWNLLQEERWTKKSPSACSVPLQINIYPLSTTSEHFKQENEKEVSRLQAFKEMINKNERPRHVEICIQPPGTDPWHREQECKEGGGDSNDDDNVIK